MQTKIALNIAFCIFLLLTLLSCTREQSGEEQNLRLDAQKRWAQKYGVNIADYPYPAVFPIYYFVDNLKRGDSIETVHTIIKGYERVYHCANWAELYYFFSSDRLSALRFTVYYDDNLQYEDITVEGTDSGDRGTTCVAVGLIKR